MPGQPCGQAQPSDEIDYSLKLGSAVVNLVRVYEATKGSATAPMVLDAAVAMYRELDGLVQDKIPLFRLLRQLVGREALADFSTRDDRIASSVERAEDEARAIRRDLEQFQRVFQSGLGRFPRVTF